MRGYVMLRYVALFLLGGFALTLSSKLFAGTPGDDLLLAGCALMMACCAVMAAACGLDALDGWRREHGRTGR
jgi:hypothetical protein